MKLEENPVVITNNWKLLKILTTIEKAKSVNVPVLILGETGTGKELIARLIHAQSDRENFVDLNCSSIPDALIESELFGHVKGSFTGADRNKTGVFEMAHNGTLFLDEIGYLSYRAQAVLLRAIETKQIKKVGSTESVKSNFRLICATNVNIKNKEIFRQDLLYRINTITLELPPLRERKEDIPDLVDYFIEKFCTEFKKPKLRVSKIDLEMLVEYHWPGNIRELKNVICQSVLSDRLNINVIVSKRNDSEIESELDLEKVERIIILKALKLSKWIQKDAAVMLGISARKLNYKIAMYGITYPNWKRNV